MTTNDPGGRFRRTFNRCHSNVSGGRANRPLLDRLQRQGLTRPFWLLIIGANRELVSLTQGVLLSGKAN